VSSIVSAGRRLITAGSLLFLLTAPCRGESTPEPELPPIQVVRELRSARIAESAGEIEKARKILEALAQTHPNEVLPLVRLVAHHDQWGGDDEGLPELRDRLTERLENPTLPIPTGSLRHLTAETSLDADQLHALESRLRRRLEATDFLPDEELELRTSLDFVYDRIDQPERQRENLGHLIEISPSFGYRWKALHLDDRMGRWESALALADPMAKEADASAAVLTAHIWLLARSGKTSVLQSALENPRYALVLKNGGLLEQIAWGLEDAGEKEAAKAYWQRLTEIAPEYTTAAEALLYLHGTLEEQRAHAATLNERWTGEESSEALLDQGTERLATGDTEAAFELLLRAAPDFPNSEAAWYNLGQAAYRLERWAVAADALEKASALNANRVESWQNRGIALFELERFEEAIAPLERALALDSSRHQVYYYLAGCYGAVGRKDDAAIATERYRQGRDG